MDFSKSDTALVVLRTFDGRTLWSERVPFEIAANTSTRIARCDVEAGNDRYLTVSSEHASFAPNRHFFVAIKNLRRPPAHVSYWPEGTEGSRILPDPERKRTRHRRIRAARLRFV